MLFGEEMRKEKVFIINVGKLGIKNLRENYKERVLKIGRVSDSPIRTNTLWMFFEVLNNK